jgi:hypothetical protein
MKIRCGSESMVEVQLTTPDLLAYLTQRGEWALLYIGDFLNPKFTLQEQIAALDTLLDLLKGGHVRIEDGWLYYQPKEGKDE